MHAFLNTAIRAARDAGKIIIQNMDQIDRIDIEYKNTNELVSEVDRMAEAAIVDLVKKSYPDHAILAEEGGKSKGRNGQEEVIWIIDPLDGTTNYLHGYPRFCVSIAVQVKGKVEHGVVYDPLLDELFSASRGDGARLNEKRIRVSSSKKLATSLIASGFPVNKFDDMESILALLMEITPKAQGIRRSGASALDLASVAAGRLDGFWEAGLQPWDIAAGSLLIREAGGIVSDFSGENDYLNSGNVIAGTPRVFAEMQKIIQSHLVK